MKRILSVETRKVLEKIDWQDLKTKKNITCKITSKWLSLKGSWGVMIFYFRPDINKIIYRFISDTEYDFNKQIKEQEIRINSKEHFEMLFEKYKQLSNLKISEKDFWEKIKKLSDVYGRN